MDSIRHREIKINSFDEMFANKPGNISTGGDLNHRPCEVKKPESWQELRHGWPATPTPAAGGSGLWSTVNELKIKEKCTMKKAICIILAAAAVVAIIISKRPRPRGRREIWKFFKKWRTFDFVLRIMIVEGILWTSVFTDFYRQPAVTGATVFSSTANSVTGAPVSFCL